MRHAKEWGTVDKTILVVDDDESILNTYTIIIKRLGCKIITITNPLEAIEIIKAKVDEIDLIITDYLMDSINGDKVIERVREIPSDIPIILSTGHAEQVPEFEMMRTLDIYEYYEKGASDQNFNDFLSKIYGGLRVSQLLRDLKDTNKKLEELTENQEILIKKRTIELERAYEQLKEFSSIDGLTLAYNRGFFDERLQQEIDRVTKQLNYNQGVHQNTEDFGLILFDIDHFKSYNDNNGHLAGDELLKELVKLVKSVAFQTDIVCRYGGEEFTVICCNTPADSVLRVAEKIRSSIEEYKFNFQENQPNGNLTISIGVSHCPGDGITKEELIKAADERLYKAKHRGRNRVEYK